MEKHDGDPDEGLSLLEEIEAAFRRMIGGIFRFLFFRLWVWLYELFHSFFDWLGRLFRNLVQFSIRLVRVGFFGTIWALLVFGPLGLVLFLKELSSPPFRVVAFSWAGLGLVGSLWGLNRWRKKAKRAQRKSIAPPQVHAAPAEQEGVSAGGPGPAHPNVSPSPAATPAGSGSIHWATSEICFFGHTTRRVELRLCTDKRNYVCARCCHEECKVKYPYMYAACEAAGWPVWPPDGA
jgi:hypothetical protein